MWDKEGEFRWRELLREPTDSRLWILMKALRDDVSVYDLVEHTGIDPWFINAMNRIVEMGKKDSQRRYFPFSS